MRLSRSFVRRLLAVALALVAPTAFTACGGGGGSPGAGNTSLVHLSTTTVASGTTGILSGVPRQVGAFQFEIAARDGIDSSIPQQRDATFAEDRKTYSVNVGLGLPNILPQQPPSAQYRASYSYQIDVAGGTQPYTFAMIGGALPAGVSVSQTGLLGSFPTQATQHPYSFTVRVTDALGQIDTDTLTLDVVVLPLIILTASPIQSAALNFAYDVPLDLASSGGGQPITWVQALYKETVSGNASPYAPPGGGTPFVATQLIVGDTLLSTIGMEIANVSGQGRFRNTFASPGPTSLGTFLFTAMVSDEAGQFTGRQYSFTVKPGPNLLTISPNKSLGGAPITLTGSNFQPGAVVIFKPGVSQVVMNPSSNSPTQLILSAVPASPGGGFVTVRVKNPDNGISDLLNAYAFPATNISFSATPIYPSPQSPLSSTGLDVGDINKDGFADFVHCGSNTTWRTATGNAAGVDLMLNNPPGGVWNNATPNFTRVQLASSGDWYDVKLADVNADGFLDVVAVGNPGTPSVRVWLQPIVGAVPATSAQWASVVPQTTSLNSSQGQATSNGWIGGPHVAGLAVGRITTDALPDIAYTQQDTTGFSSSPQYGGNGGRVSTMKGLGNGTFSGLQVSGQTIYFSSLANGVGIVPSTSSGKGNVVITDAAGGFQAYWNGYGGQAEIAHVEATNTSDLFGSWTAMNKTGTYASECLCAATGDVNGDGIVDVVIPTSITFVGGATQAVFSFMNNGTTFTAVQATAGSAGAERFATVFDIDFDSFNDCAITVAPNKVDFFKGRTGNTGLQFKTSVQVTTNSPNVSRIAAGDFDKDGRIDVCVCTSFLADNANATGSGGYAAAATTDRGLGGVQGVFFLLNTSN